VSKVFWTGAAGWWGVLAALCLFSVVRGWGENCYVCSQPPGDYVFLVPDQVEHDKKTVCESCAKNLERCYLCGLPAAAGSKELGDGRVLCARDIKLAVLDEDEAGRICEDLKLALDRHFSRFMSIPEVLSSERIDRISLISLAKVPGNDNSCPNIQGYTKPVTGTNSVAPQFRIYLMSGLTAPNLKATLAHEYGHAWFLSNVPAARRLTISRDSHEGFCELLAYLLMDEQGERGAQSVILSNGYTRGQFALLLEAQQRFGLSDVLDWVKYGVDRQLESGAVERVRNVQMPQTSATRNVLPWRPGPQSGPGAPNAAAEEGLILKSVVFSSRRPLVLINNRSFERNETGKVKYGESNLTVKCVSIFTNAVLIYIAETDETLSLRLGQKTRIRPLGQESPEVLLKEQSD